MNSSNFTPLTDLLRQSRDPNDAVAWVDGQRQTWQVFSKQVRCLTAQFMQRPEQRWGVYFECSYQFSVVLMALLHSGKVPVLAGSDCPGATRNLMSKVDVLIGDFPFDALQLDQLLHSEAGADVQLSQLDKQQTLEIFTSGSTGQPKAEIKRLGQLQAEVNTLQAHWGDQLQQATVFATVSHQHIYGLLFKVLWPLSAGCAFVSHRYREPAGLLEHVQQFDSAVWVASPAHLKRLHDELPWGEARQRLQLVFSSGGVLPMAPARQLEQWLGYAPIEVYGSTESGGIGWRQQVERADALWQPLNGVTVSRHSEGYLQVKSAHLADDGWLMMADEVELFESEQFRLLGRLDRIVKVEEKRVSLPELEAVLLKSALVDEVRAILLSTSSRQQIGVAAVLSEAGRSYLDEDGRQLLIKQLKDELAPWFEMVALPRQWRFVAALPINTQGKVQQKEVEALFEKPRRVFPEVHSEQLESNQLNLVLGISEALDYFPGHFPSASILPGVVQINWAEQFGRQHFSLGAFSKMESLKFQRVIRPGSNVSLSLRHDPDKSALHFCYESAEGIHSQGRLKFV